MRCSTMAPSGSRARWRTCAARCWKQQFACNVFGWHQLTRECLPLMRANGAGRIVQCSSVLGLVALKWRGAYNASKFAVEALADTLRLELRGSGIFVSLIEPGPITSKFVETSLKNFEKNIDEASSHYKEAYAKQRATARARRFGALQAGARGGAGETGPCGGIAAPARALLRDEAHPLHGGSPGASCRSGCSTTCSTRPPTSEHARALCAP